jgi:hypothetical protein
MSPPTPVQIASVLNSELAGWPELSGLDFTRLHATASIVREQSGSGSSLSNAIFDATFPRADASKEYFHYTRQYTFESIIGSGDMRLYWLKKRLSDYEYQTFCDDHSLDGYTEVDPLTGVPLFDSIAEDLFYLSVTEKSGNPTMWELFGDKGNGACLRLTLTPIYERSQLRHIRYKGTQRKTMIRIIQDTIKDTFGLHFILDGLSRVPAFYLPMMLKDENEIRLISNAFGSIRTRPMIGEPYVRMGRTSIFQFRSVNRTAFARSLSAV